MSKHDTEIALRQILSHAREAVEIAHGKTRSDLDADRLLNLALTRLLEIIGEAANRVPDESRSKYPDLPWLQMIGARSRKEKKMNNADNYLPACLQILFGDQNVHLLLLQILGSPTDQ